MKGENIMKAVNIFLGIAFLFLAVIYPVTNTLPTMFVVVLMCLIISLNSFTEFIRIKTKEIEIGKQ